MMNLHDLARYLQQRKMMGDAFPTRGPSMGVPNQNPVQGAVQTIQNTQPVQSQSASPQVTTQPIMPSVPKFPSQPTMQPSMQPVMPMSQGPNLNNPNSGGGVGTNPLFGLYNLPQQQLQFRAAQEDIANQNRINAGNLLAQFNQAGIPGGGAMAGALTQLAQGAQSTLGNFRNQLAIQAPEQQWQHSLQAEQLAQQIQQFNQNLQQQRYLQGQQLGVNQYQFGQNLGLARLNQLMNAMGPGLNAGTAGLAAANVLGNAAAQQYAQSQYANGLLGTANQNQQAAGALGGGGLFGPGGFGTTGINGPIGGGYTSPDLTTQGMYGAQPTPAAFAPIQF